MANDSISVSVKGGGFPLPPLHRTKNNYHSPPMGYFRIAYKTSRLSPKILCELRFKISLGIRKRNLKQCKCKILGDKQGVSGWKSRKYRMMSYYLYEQLSKKYPYVMI